MKQDRALKNELQLELLNVAVFINNRSPTSTLQNFKTLYEALKGDIPEVDYIRRIGYRAYKLVPKRKFLKKYDERTYLRVLVGFDRTHVYRLQDPVTSKVERTKEVLFDKDIRLDYSQINVVLPTKSTRDTAPQAPEEVLPNRASVERYSTRFQANLPLAYQAIAIQLEQEKHKNLPNNSGPSNLMQQLPPETQTTTTGVHYCLPTTTQLLSIQSLNLPESTLTTRSYLYSKFEGNLDQSITFPVNTNANPEEPLFRAKVENLVLAQNIETEPTEDEPVTYTIFEESDATKPQSYEEAIASPYRA